MAELTLVDSHFRFGENWAEFARGVNPDRIEQAQIGVARLLGRDDLSGLRFLDIGSGSGLHSLAALRLGAASVTAIDIDFRSVATTKELLARFAPGAPWSVELKSVFDLTPVDLGHFDIVYSWGVLHHTGAMLDAIRAAVSLVGTNGSLCMALYRRTALCGLWRIEKRIYSRAPKWVQLGIRGAFVAMYWFVQSARVARHRRRYSFRADTDDYLRRRGMNFYTDVHDWLGGYPYESISPREIRDFMSGLGFVEERSFIKPPSRGGLFGSGCDEYVFVRKMIRA